jgi:hypothetical protein
MSQITRTPKIYDVCIIGSGARPAAPLPRSSPRAGSASRMLEAGPRAQPRGRLQRACVALRARPIAAQASARKLPRPVQADEFHRPQRRLGHRRRALHDRTRLQLPLVPLAHRRRTHQSLGPYRVALRASRFSRTLHGRDGRRLAHRLRRTRALLRQSRIVHRRLRHDAKIFPARPDGVFLPPPKPRCTEDADAKSLRQA